MKNLRSRQAFISENSCSEFSKMKFVPVSIVKVQITRMETLLDAILKYYRKNRKNSGSKMTGMT